MMEVVGVYRLALRLFVLVIFNPTVVLRRSVALRPEGCASVPAMCCGNLATKKVSREFQKFKHSPPSVPFHLPHSTKRHDRYHDNQFCRVKIQKEKKFRVGHHAKGQWRPPGSQSRFMSSGVRNLL